MNCRLTRFRRHQHHDRRYHKVRAEQRDEASLAKQLRFYGFWLESRQTKDESVELKEKLVEFVSDTRPGSNQRVGQARVRCAASIVKFQPTERNK